MVDHAPARPGACPRLVHLLDVHGGGEDAVLSCLAASHIPGWEHHVWLLGSTDDERLAADLGLRTTDRLSVASGPAYRAALTLGRLQADRRAAWGRSPDALVAWSAEAARLAEAEMWGVPRRLLVLTVGPGPATDLRMSVVPALIDSDAWGVCAVGQGLADLWAEALVPGVTPLPIPVHAAPTMDDDRADVRAALRIEPGELVLMLLADPARSGDAVKLSSIAGLFHYAGVPGITTMASARSAQAARAARYVAIHHRRWDLLSFQGPLGRAMAGADLVLWDVDEDRAGLIPGRPTGGAVLAARACALGLPVIAPDHLVTRDVLGLLADACVARGAQLPGFAQRLMPLVADADARRRVGDALALQWADVGVLPFQEALRRELLATPASPSRRPD